ncbi:MAG: alkaline phosphatase [Wenzhouxiangellaceae bacterium]|nr:alkaline phosphatase [Wenzhouxiangellaceae bacterium]
MRSFLSTALALVLLTAAVHAVADDCPAQATGHNAIFFHPDGTSAGHWDAMRLLYYGPDGQSHWDRLPRMAAYRGHLSDQLSSTSNAGASIHATGTRTWSGAFGQDEEGNKLAAADGSTRTIMEQAVACGLRTALVQTGTLIEPGTAVFVANARHRYLDAESIALQVVESGVDILLGAGEELLLPAGVQGRFGAGIRSDGRNLIDEARARGYAVVYTRDELFALPADATRVLGVFNVEDSYFDQPEEDLRAAGLPNYLESAPTVAEMTRFALDRLGKDERGLFMVIEEEGSDNFCNKRNASGCLEAMKRADDAIGVIVEFIARNPETFMVTASDSNAGGMQIFEVDAPGVPIPAREDKTGALLDGIDGSESAPFLSAPDVEGRQFPFAVAWAVGDDTGSGVIARGAGLNAETLVPASGVANTDIYRMLYFTLFGEVLP